jgi:hypothetical protein
MRTMTSEVAFGHCHCGCGELTNLSPNNSNGRIKGEPYLWVRGHHQRKQPSYRVEDRGHETPCWIWTLGTNSAGYGMSRGAGGSRLAHRVLWEVEHGPVPEGLELDHLCRVRLCVNPAHLEAVTRAINCRRGARTKLSEAEARQIRDLCAAGVLPQREVATLYGIGKSTVGEISKGEIWRPPRRIA